MFDGDHVEYKRSALKLIIAHNRYQERGGEDTVFAAEVDMLRQHGHEVFPFVDDNRRIQEMHTLQIAARALYSRDSYRTFLEYLDYARPDLCHFHNTLPLLSSSVYNACRERGVPVVQTLHNYRLICPVATLFRDGRACEDCVGKYIPWPGVLHACYRDDRSASAVIASMITYQKLTGRWSTNADLFIAVTEFARSKFIQGGLPAERIRVKPNFVAKDRGMGDGDGGYFLYVGRLTKDKGLETLVKAWEDMDQPLPLHIVGNGPMRAELEQAASLNPFMEMKGFIPIDQVFEEMKGAMALVFPSLNYEGFPRTIVEAFSVGLPVIASDLGSIATIVTHGHDGLLFPAGDPEALRASVMHISEDEGLRKSLREGSRRDFENRFNAERNYARLMEIYELVLENPAGDW